MEDRIDGLVVDALYEELMKLPLGVRATPEQVADASPRLAKEDDGCYVVVGERAVITPVNLEDLMGEALFRAREAGLYVDKDFEQGSFSLHEYMPADEFDFDEIESMRLQYGAVMRIDRTEFKYDRETLSMTDGSQGFPGFEEHALHLDDSMRDDLAALFEEADVRHWERDYEPVGVAFCDGYSWNLVVRFEDGRVFVSGGSNAWPEAFRELWDGMCVMLGLAYRW